LRFPSFLFFLWATCGDDPPSCSVWSQLCNLFSPRLSEIPRLWLTFRLSSALLGLRTPCWVRSQIFVSLPTLQPNLRGIYLPSKGVFPSYWRAPTPQFWCHDRAFSPRIVAVWVHSRERVGLGMCCSFCSPPLIDFFCITYLFAAAEVIPAIHRLCPPRR